MSDFGVPHVRPGEGMFFQHLAPAAPGAEIEPAQGGEPPSAGTNSSTSSSSTATNSEPGEMRRPRPARGVGRR